ncbi:MAG: NUDIX domain-containing protein [Pseudomonadota bacterium]
MKPIFLYGTLRHLPLLEIVAGRADAGTPAELADHAVFHAGEAPFPRLEPAPGQTARGLLVEAGEALERLDFYEGGYGYGLVPVTVETAAGPREARVYRAGAGVAAPGAPWSLEAWIDRFGPMTCHLAREAMGYLGQITAEELAARMPAMAVRAQARHLAETGARPAPLAPLPPDAVEMVETRLPYSGFFSVAEADLRHRQFDGSMGPLVRRASFLSGDAVVVLPYDPVRDRVHLIEQYRMGPLFRGDPHRFLIEAIAGRVDPGESPEEAAHREAMEEAALTLGALHEVSRSYPSPGAMSEFLHIFVGIADLPDAAQGLGGAAAEDEDIRSTLLDYADFEARLDGGGLNVGPLIIAGHWLARNRERLRS